jgi:hypothetical protein
MGKMVYLLGVVISCQLALLLVFDQAIPGSTLWNLFTNPQLSWSTLSLTSLMADTITLISATTIIAGALWFKSDFLVYAGITGVFLSFGIGLANVWQQIKSLSEATGNGALVASIIIGPIIFLYIITVLEFWRGKD